MRKRSLHPGVVHGNGNHSLIMGGRSMSWCFKARCRMKFDEAHGDFPSSDLKIAGHWIVSGVFVFLLNVSFMYGHGMWVDCSPAWERLPFRSLTRPSFSNRGIAGVPLPSPVTPGLRRPISAPDGCVGLSLVCASPLFPGRLEARALLSE